MKQRATKNTKDQSILNEIVLTNNTPILEKNDNLQPKRNIPAFYDYNKDILY